MSNFNYSDNKPWEEWQSEYKYGAFYIFPPEGVIEPIDNLRKIYDPKSASYCQAHISLSESLRGPLTNAQLEELRENLSSLQPFNIKYGQLRSFLPYPGVVYTITPEENVKELRSTIQTTSLFKNSPLKRQNFTPHMTIAEFITVDKTNELLITLSDKVPQGTFLCDAIEYAIPDDNFAFKRVLSIPLGKTS